MGQVVNVIETSPGAVTSFEVDVGAASLQENDLIYILLSWRVSGTLAISGYTAIGTKQSTDAYDSQWFCRKATASESNPTASTTGAAATPTAVVVVFRGADSSGTALDSVNAHGNRGGSTGATLTSADLTTTVDDCVILHGVTWDQTSVIAPLADMNRLATGSGCVGVTYKATAGAIPTFTFTGSNASNTGRAWAIAIKNASGGDKPVRLVDGRDYLQKLGGFATLTAGLPDSVSGLTQMAGVMMHTAANLSGGFGSFTLGTGIATGSGWGTPGGAFTSNERCAVTAWVGRFLGVSSISVTGKIISIPWQVGTTGDSGRVGPKGYVITLVDSSNNWATYQVLPQKDWYASRRGVLVIKPGTTPLLASSLTEPGSSGVACDFDHLVNIGYFYQRAALPTSDASVQWFCHLPIIENSVCAFVGGGSTIPVTTAIEARYLRGGTPLLQGCPEQVSFQGSGQLVNRIGMQLGDGSTATYSKHTAQSYDIPATDETGWRVGAGGAPLIIKASASDTHDLRSAIITSSILQPFTIDAASSLSASILTTGLSVIGRTFSDLAGYDWTSASWTECDTVAFKNGDLTTCTIASPNAAIDGTTGAACSFSANGAVIAGSTISCVKASGAVTGYHAAFGAALTAITINNTTLSGTPGANKFYSALASGTLTITTDGLGTALADTDVTFIGGSTAVAVIVSPTSDITFAAMIAGGTLKVFTTGTQTELFSDTNTATSEVWTGASGTFDYTWIKEGYLPIRATGEVVSGSRTITLQPVVDRAYVASSGLTFGTNLFYAPGTKLAGLTTASTLQNLYSALIEAYRVEATLQNKPFPLAANGPNSFSWLNGNTFDLATYPNSITLLSRDGMQYLDTSGAATDIWAAVLSVGVPAGMQVRYQQQDGIGTTNALTTGNIDQLIQIYKTGTGAFDYRNWLVLKVQAEGYDQAEAVVLDIYPTLDDQLFVVALVPTPNGIAAGAADATVTITSEPTPVTWNGQDFSTTIKDTTNTHSGLEIMQAIRALNDFNMHDMIRPHGTKFQTVTGNVYGDTLTTPAGVRVVKADGTTPHPDFDLFVADNASTYTPPVIAPIEWAGALDGTTVLLYNDVGGGAGVIIDTQVISGAGGYNLDVSLPSVDVAVGDPLRIRFGHKQYYAGEIQGTMTSTGWTAVGTMVLHPVYAGWGLNGSDYDQINGGSFTMDGTHLQIDINNSVATGLKKQLGAWTQHLMTIPAGLAAFYGAWDLLELNQIRQNVDKIDVLLDLPVAGAQFAFTDNEVNYYRSDFSLPYNIEAGHGNIFLTYNAKPFVSTVAVGGSPMTIDDRDAIIAAIPSANANANAVWSKTLP